MNVVPCSGANLLDLAGRTSVATIGHLLDTGFLPSPIRRISGAGVCAGYARTVSVPNADAYALNSALAHVRQGEVLVVHTDGDQEHAFVGAVTATAARAVGAAGIIVDGLVTDVDHLADIGLPIFARGTAGRTTKYRDISMYLNQTMVTIGLTPVRPGDLIVADSDGVVVIDPDAAVETLESCILLDSREPDVLRRLERTPVHDVLPQQPPFRMK